MLAITIIFSDSKFSRYVYICDQNLAGSSGAWPGDPGGVAWVLWVGDTAPPVAAQRSGGTGQVLQNHAPPALGPTA